MMSRHLGGAVVLHFRKVAVRILILTIWLFPATFLFAANPVDQPFTFSWDRVKGAGGYLIEIMNPAGAVVVTEKAAGNDSTKTVRLPPGAYRMRMTTLNRFMRAEAATEWVAIRVDAPTPPVFVSISPDTMLTGHPQSISLLADNMANDATASIRSPSDMEIPVKTQRTATNRLKLTLPPLEEPGVYKIAIINPPDLRAEIAGGLMVNNPPAVIAGFEPATFQNDLVEAIVQVNGSEFSPLVQVFLKNEEIDSQEIPLSVVSVSKTRVTASLPPGMAPGNYNLTLINQPDEAPIGLVGQRITIVSPPEPIVEAPPIAIVQPIENAVIEVFEAPPAKTKPALSSQFSLGWGAIVPLSVWAEIYEPTAAAATLRADFFITPRVRPVSEGVFDFSLGVDARLASFLDMADPSIVKSSLTNVSLTIDPSVVWSLPFLSVAVRAGGGLAYSSLSTTANDGGSLAMDSIDAILLAEADLMFPLFDALGAGISVHYSHVFFTTGGDFLGFSTFASLSF